MRKIISFALLLVMTVFSVASVASAADWSQYESGRDNIRLDGYQGQPGYVAFTDGNGTTLGYLWMSSDYNLVYCSFLGAHLTTTKLTNDTHGLRVSDYHTTAQQTELNP